MARQVFPLADIPEGFLGGPKALALAALARAGFAVPAGIVLSAQAYDSHVTALWGHRPEALSDEERARLCDGLRGGALQSTLMDEVAAELDKVGLTGSPLAVRSSSTVEDGQSLSSAGVQDTVLGVHDASGLADAITAVWASLWSNQACAYRKNAAAAKDYPLMAVIIQRLLKPDAAGVLFTVNPITGRGSEMLINSTFGLAEPLMSGKISPDTFVVDKASLRASTSHVVTKDHKTVAGHSGLEEVTVPQDRALAPSLSPDQVRQVAELGVEIEKHFGAPRDVEWALCGDELAVLQARPITTLPKDTSLTGTDGTVDASNEDIWTNANVGEALPGVASPLTWSIASRYSDRGFRRAFEALACEVPAGAVLVGTCRGRVYLNLTTFLKIAAQVPFLSGQTLMELAGVHAPVAGVSDSKRRSSIKVSLTFLKRLPEALVKLTSQHTTLDRKINEIEPQVISGWNRLCNAPLEHMVNTELKGELARTDRLLEWTGDVMLTCAASSLATYLVLRDLVRWWLPDHLGMERELLAGASDLESAKPGIALWHLAEAIRADPVTKQALLDAGEGELGPDVFGKTHPLKRDIEAFLATYGYRGVREAELSAPRWREDHSLIFATLRETVRSGGPPPGRELQGRLDAWKTVWKTAQDQLGATRQSVMRHLVSAGRKYARLRERLRARVTQVLGMYRILALEAGRRMGDEQAAFFLTVDELHRYLGGELTSLGPLISARRWQHEWSLALPDPPATFVGRPEGDSPPPPPQGDQLQGLAASHGKATGKARVLRDSAQANELRAGDILVVACADVGWSPLFLVAGAIVTELGGVLSHASVVAREYGVPAVVGVTNATRLIKNGKRSP